MNRIDRLFGITTLLQAKKYVPAEQIAAHFGISVRTVYRDIKSLGEQGIPVSFEPHRGYFLVQGYFLPPVSFTQPEASALVLLQALAATLVDKSIQTPMAAALHKVKAVLRSSDQDRLEQFAHQLKLHVPEYCPSERDYLAALQAAIVDRRVLDMEYGDKRGVTSQRQVEPIGLVFYNFAWHLIGWCQLRQQYRDFKVARMQRLTSTTRPFTRTQHRSLADYLADLHLPYPV
ncbi:helix-turn-helix transcriptional regulator [Hymenobacter crusticola]|uniref:DNA-binding transcriptional regulator n=1 Tax=Hymenobacter crusticola TaxID=1770526 RepID=A0A243W5P7_9BACT|nr:YafY family protein [Hymenobacter crusticola]OUJ68412.1 DNA-binding transcriptional regulator [Hymenobacter crusticola]